MFGLFTPKPGDRSVGYVQCENCGTLHEHETYYNFNTGGWLPLNPIKTCMNCGKPL